MNGLLAGKVRRTLAAASASVLFLLGACTSDEGPSPDNGAVATPTPPPRRGGSVTFGVIGEPATLDPYSEGASDLTHALARPLYPSLYRLLPDGSAEPYLARSLTETSRGATVRLRRARWSDGRPIGAADAVASIERALPPSGLALIDKAEAAGPRTIELTGAVDDWQGALATQALIVPQDGRRAYGGPFSVAGTTSGLEIVYRPNKRWFGGKAPLLKEVRVQFIEGLDILVGLLRSGRLDSGAPPATINLAGRLESQDIEISSALGWESLRADLSRSDLSIAERAWVAGSIDRSLIASVLAGDAGRLSNSLRPGPGPTGADGAWSSPLPDEEMPAETIEVASPRDDELLELMQEAIYRQLTAAGASVELTSIEGSEFYGGWLDANPVDLALLRSAGAPGPAKESMEFENLDALPLAHVRTYVAAGGTRLVGPRPNPTLDGPLWNMHEWYLGPSGN
ncbi:MAG: hypothetical protein H0V97_06415 [Actinobacteria bacterium]|nr:hypothetical protein [Actinomycetota bacterium]